MRILVALLVVLAVLYYWDANYNHGTLFDGLIRMKRSMFHHISNPMKFADDLWVPLRPLNSAS
jgi:hypothetical protein